MVCGETDARLTLSVAAASSEDATEVRTEARKSSDDVVIDESL